jgi:alkylation response protein AidB-like acyl-CoA dehydrogenase
MTTLATTIIQPATFEQLIATQLAPQVTAIDLEGRYPEAFLRQIGQAGAFAGVVAPEYGGNGAGIGNTIASMAKIGEACLSTAFMHWCQTACARYIQLSDNAGRDIQDDRPDGREGEQENHRCLADAEHHDRHRHPRERRDHAQELEQR